MGVNKYSYLITKEEYNSILDTLEMDYNQGLTVYFYLDSQLNNKNNLEITIIDYGTSRLLLNHRVFNKDNTIIQTLYYENKIENIPKVLKINEFDYHDKANCKNFDCIGFMNVERYTLFLNDNQIFLDVNRYLCRMDYEITICSNDKKDVNNILQILGLINETVESTSKFNRFEIYRKIEEKRQRGFDVIECEKSWYVSEYEAFCYQNCLKLLLNFYNVIDNEFYLNMSLSMNLKTENFMDINFKFDKNSLNILPRFSNKVRRYDYKQVDCDIVFEDNVYSVMGGNKIIVGVDSYYLSHLPFYKKSHGRHTMIMTGYDKKSKQVEVIDWVEPWFFKGFIPEDEFLYSRNSLNIFDGGVFSGSAINNNWAEIDCGGWEFNIDKLIEDNIVLSYEQYFCKKSDKYFHGIDSIIEIYKRLDSLESYSETEQVRFINNLHNGLYRTVKKKFLFRYFLDIAYRKNKSQNFKRTSQQMSIILENWEKFLFRLLKYSLRLKKGYSQTLKFDLENIINEENKLGKYIQYIIENT